MRKLCWITVVMLACAGDDEGGVASSSDDTGDPEASPTGPTTYTPAGGDLLLACRDLPYQSTCRDADDPGLLCADYFGGFIDELVQPTCEGGGTWDKVPCSAQPHPVGACVSDAAGTDLCYIQHIAATDADGVQAARDFWVGACAAVGGLWVDPS